MEAAAQFKLVERIVEAVTAHPPKNLSPDEQTFTDLHLCWSVCDVGRIFGGWYGDEPYALRALELVGEMIERHPMRMAAAISAKAVYALSSLMKCTCYPTLPPNERMYTPVSVSGLLHVCIWI